MRKIIYAFGIATFLAMFIFTIATSLTIPFYGMSEAALAQTSSSSSGTGTGNNCVNQDCETPCDKDYSRHPIEKAREYINTTICCEYRYHYFDGNGNLIEVIYKKYNQTRVCVSSDMIEWCHRCKDTWNNG